MTFVKGVYVVLMATASVASHQQGPIVSAPAVTTPTPAALPVATEAEQLRVTLAAKDIRLAMLQLEKANGALQGALARVEKPGFVVQVDCSSVNEVSGGCILTYSKAKAPPATPAPSLPGGGGVP